jgi:hypothetical protein
MIYTRKITTGLAFRDINTGNWLLLDWADTANSVFIGQRVEWNGRKNFVWRPISGQMAFDVVDTLTGNVVDKGRP